jgi:hypothetical protein
MEDTGHIFWKHIDTLMAYVEHVEAYQLSGKISPLSPASVSGDLVRFGGYSWIVISADPDENKFMLVAGRLLAIMPMKYHDEKVETTWENSKIRTYLNTTYLNKMSPGDQEKVQETTHANPDTPWFNTPGGNDTTDKVFLLSLEELVKYLGDSTQLSKKAWPRDTAIDTTKPCIINDEYDNLRCAKNEFGEFFHYWLRSAGRDATCAAIVREDGTLDLGGESVDTTAGVRPAMWVKL